MREPDEYVLERIRAALATDDRLGQLDIQVSVTSNQVLLDGVVATEERKTAAAEVAGRIAGDRDVFNGLQVEHLRDRGEAENIT
ncbi:MAG TPA: BON domain-containing protein [Actinomycetota bacterium]|nr:BON domain-containing protein [Actinomycetota bacterium]